jgi:type II secretory pathway component GspD/PulD (secretin)
LLLLAVFVSVSALPWGHPETCAASSDLSGLKGADEKVTLRFTDTEASKVFEALGDAAGFSASVADDVKDVRITIQAQDESVKQILESLARQYELTYEVTAAGDLEVRSGGGW